MGLHEEIQSLVEGEVSTDVPTLRKYSRDASLFEVTPQVVVAPKTAEDIKKLVTYVTARNKKIKKGPKISLTARSGGTDMTGGPLSESIVLDFTTYFNRIKEVNEHHAITQPGVYYRDFEKETLKKNRLLPSYPASREICTVGGMAANNSGGEKSLTYGQTKDYIEELKMVLADGKEYVIKPLSKKELNKKIKERTFEGKAYHALYKLIEKNYDAIKKAKPAVSKNSAGYYLWDVWDKETFDLTKLFAGSQGTLGIITEITYRLIQPKKYTKLLVMFLKEKDIKNLGHITNAILRYKPESFESNDDNALKLALRYLPDLIKLLKPKNILTLGFKFLPEAWMMLTGGFPKLILLAEFTGDDENEITQKARAAENAVRAFSITSRITKSHDESQKYWVIRRESFNLFRHHVKDKHTAPFIDDVIVRPEKLPEFLPRLNAILKEYDLTYTVAGHIGNGNFHIIPLMDTGGATCNDVIRELSKKAYDLVLEFKGSITAEHNDGIIRTPFLEAMYGKEITGLFKEVKDILDPQGIFNPGKKVGGTWEYAMSHLEKEC